MRQLIELCKGRRLESSQEISLDEAIDNLTDQETKGRCIQFGRPGLGILHKIIDQNNVDVQGMKVFMKTYGGIDHYRLDHEEYKGKRGSMHYLDFSMSIGGPKFIDGKLYFGLDYLEPIAQVSYFVPRRNKNDA